MDEVFSGSRCLGEYYSDGLGTAEYLVIAEFAGRRGRVISFFKKSVIGFSNTRYVPAATTRPVASIAPIYVHAWPTGLMARLVTIQPTKLNVRRCVQ